MEGKMSRVMPNLTELLQETKSAHVMPETDESLGGVFKVVNQDEGVLGYFDNEQQANQFMRENLRGKSWSVGDGDTTRQRLDEKQGVPTELRPQP
jgi:hypothetical protein